ncbi:hypothetical protein L218DRAFT_1021591 [Marasmius fiardii PR-910]|nr:hypothetical protein L218DRAFT_1021591 [Marasmius fiardii PR-910]
MGQLSPITGDTVLFHWTYAEQHAFEDIKHLAEGTRDHHQVSLDYSKDVNPVWLVTDGWAGVPNQNLKTLNLLPLKGEILQLNHLSRQHLKLTTQQGLLPMNQLS